MTHSGPYRAEDPRTWLPDWTERPDCVAALQAATAALEAGRPFRPESVRRWGPRPESAELAAARQRWAAEEATGRTRCGWCGLHHTVGRSCTRCGPVAQPGETLGDVLARLEAGPPAPRAAGLFGDLLETAGEPAGARFSGRDGRRSGRGAIAAAAGAGAASGVSHG